MHENGLFGPDLFGRQPVKKKVQTAHPSQPIRPVHPKIVKPKVVQPTTVHTAKVVKKPAKPSSHPTAGQAKPVSHKPQAPTSQRHPAVTTPTAVVWPVAPKKRIQPLRIPAQPPTVSPQATPGGQAVEVVWPVSSAKRIRPISTTLVPPNPQPKPRPIQPVQPDKSYAPEPQPDIAPDVTPEIAPGSPDEPNLPSDNTPMAVPEGGESSSSSDTSLPTNQPYTPVLSQNPSSGDNTSEMMIGGLIFIGLLYLFTNDNRRIR